MKAGRQLIASAPLLMLCIHLQAQVSDPLNRWEIIAQPTGSLRGLAHKDGTLVAVGYRTNIIVSTNGGANWFFVPINLPDFFGAMGVTDGAGQFVAVGWGGVILSSTNGLQWTQRRSGRRPEELWAVTYGGGQFVGVGYGISNGVSHALAVTSADGINWERFAVPIETSPRNIAYGKGTYVAVGPISMCSTNGRDWKVLDGVLAQGVAYGGGQFVAAAWPGDQGGHRSSNGVDWTAVRLPGLSYSDYITAAYANGMFIIGGYCDACTNGSRPSLLATSTDGQEWTSRVFGMAEGITQIQDIVFVDGRFYLAEYGGRIWRSGRMAPVTSPAITRITQGGAGTDLSFTTVPGFQYRVEYALDLGSADWTRLSSQFASGDQLGVNDLSTASRSRFYRVRVE